MDKIDYIEFPTSDGRASSRFFSGAFGWQLINYGPAYTGIDGGIDAGTARVAAPLAVIRTTDLDDAERRVVAAGRRTALPFPRTRGSELAVYQEKS